MKELNVLLELLLKESVYSIEDVQRAIDTQTPMTISKTAMKANSSMIATFNVIPEEIDGDLIIGHSKQGEKIEFELKDIEAILFINEGVTPGIKMTAKALNNMDADKLGNLAETTPIEITEEEELQENDKVFDDIEKDIKGETIEALEQENQQELAIFNVKNWAAQLEVDLGNIHKFNKGIEEFQFLIKDKPFSVLIYTDGTIRMSGHTIKTFDDFKKVIEYQKIY